MNEGEDVKIYCDKVVLRQVPFNITVGLDAWGKDKPQPVLLSLEIPADLRKAAKTDDVSETLDYGKLFKTLNSKLAVPSTSAAEMAWSIHCMLQSPNNFFTAKIVLPKGSLRAGGGLHFTFTFSQEDNFKEHARLEQTLSIKGISCACIVGVNPHEREEKQIVEVNLEFQGTFAIYESQERLAEYLSHGVTQYIMQVPHVDIVRKVVTLVEGSTYQTVEALASAIAKTVTVTFDIPSVWVEVEKPNAIAAIEAAGVRIYREKTFYTEDNFWKIRQP